MENIFKKLKNKPDFKSIILETDKAQIFIQKTHTYFETTYKYNLTIDFYKSNTRESYRDLSLDKAKQILKDYKITKYET